MSRNCLTVPEKLCDRKFDKSLRVLLVCDQYDWILGKIAQQLSSHLNDFFDIIVLARSDKYFFRELIRLQKQSDLIHFLGPSDYYKSRPFIHIPCVLTFWHMVDWTNFDMHASRLDTLCVGSRQWQERVEEHIDDNLPIFRMPYGLDTKEFSRFPEARCEYLKNEMLPENTLVFGIAGSVKNIDNRKGWDRVFASLRLLKENLGDALILRAIGKGWKPEMIPPDLVPYVRLEYHIPDSELPKYYSSLDYLLCLSRIEGVPYPVLEAMSCESVVISTPVGVVPEIIQHKKNGFILNEQNISDELIEIIKQTSNNLNYRHECGELARETIVNNYHWENVIDPTLFKEIYLNAIVHFEHRGIKDRLKIRYVAMREQVSMMFHVFLRRCFIWQ